MKHPSRMKQLSFSRCDMKLFVFDVSVAMNAKRVVQERACSKQCLECGCKTSKKRGLCIDCYNAFYYVASRMSARRRAMFEAACIKQGKLLRSYEKAYRPTRSVFQAIADKKTN